MKQDILEGIRVVEVASWSFVPSSGATLADWGADVIKIEHPVTGDPQRGLISSGVVTAAGSVNHFIEQPNRGKRSLGLDIASDAGREVLRKLVEQSDVFVTNLLPASRARAGIDVDDVRAWNPKVIYARGNGYGPRGEQAGRGGFDLAVYWARGGIGDSLITGDGEWPAPQRPAFGDVFGGFALAAGIVAALFANAAVRFQNRRECIAILRATFEAQPLAHWEKALNDFEGVWDVFRTAPELHDDPQVKANGYLPSMTDGNGNTFSVAASPVQFDERSLELTAAPEHGQHTEEILLELGYDWDQIVAFKEIGATN